MSTTIDQRVVEMQFDNRQFEKNVSTTMSTLDKLKAKLHLDGATKGFDNLNNSVNKVNMSPLGKAVETVGTKFSALEVMGVTALANITNSAVNAGKRIVSSLTVQPVMDGWKEYEMTLNAVQTTMAGTGKTSAEVEKELKKLDEYADKTVYSTSDMLNNLPKFTNAGVELENATKAMIGIANATALAGGDAGKASIAFYNLGQAIGTGYLTRMDYNSINNAGIATMEWKNQMVEAALAAGTLTKAGDDMYKAGNKTLTLQQLFIDGLQEQWATTDVLMKVFEDYGNETTEIGKKAYSAAQDIKTYSQMMESLKATAGTGWKDTWQIIFGNLEEAKEFWTGLTNFISGIITKMADVRNAILESALGRKFGQISHVIKTIKKPIDGAVESIQTIGGALENLDDIVNRVIRGEFGNSDTGRFEKLTELGYNYCKVQNKVNETLGSSVRYTEDEIAVQDELLGIQKKSNDSSSEVAAATKKLTEADAEYIASLTKKTDKELEALNLSPQQIKAIRQLTAVSKKLGIPVEDLIKNIDEINGRWLLINSFKNIGQNLVGVFKAMGKAWITVFPETSINNIATGLFNLIAAFHKLTSSIRLVDEDGKLTETGNKIGRTFAGLFALLKIVATLTAGPLRIAFKLIKGLLAALDLDILSVTAAVGDALVAFSDWLDKALDFEAMFKSLIAFFKDSPKYIKKWYESFKQSKIFQAMLPLIEAAKEKIKALVNAFKETALFKKASSFFAPFIEGIKTWFKGLKEAESIPKYLFQGLINGFKKGASDIWDFVSNIFVKLIEIVNKVLGIESPSKVFMAIGGFIVAGLLVGLSQAFPGVWDAVNSFADNCLGLIGKVDWGAILAGVVGVGSIASLYKFTSFLSSIGSIADGVGDLLSGTGKVLSKSAGAIKYTIKNFGKIFKNFAKILGGISMDLKAGAVKKFAVALLIMVGALVGLAIAMNYIEPKQLWTAVGALAALAGIMTVMAIVIDKFNTASASWSKEGGAKISGMSSTIIQIGICMLLMAAAMKIAGSMSPEAFKQGLIVVGAFGVLILGLIAAGRLAGKDPIKSAMVITKTGALISAVGKALLLLAVTLKILGGMEWSELAVAGAAIGGFAVVVAGLIWATKLAGPSIDAATAILSKIGAAFLLVAIAAKIIGTIDWEDLGKAGAAIGGFAVVIAGLIWATKLAGKDLDRLGVTILAIAGAIAILAGVAIVCGLVDPGKFWRGYGAVAALGAMVALLMWATRLVGDNAWDLHKTLLAVAAAIAILAGVCIILGLIDPGTVWKGIGAVAALTVLMAGLIAVTYFAKDVNKNIWSLAILIGALGAVIIALSFIPAENLLPAVLALIIVMSSLTILMAVVGTMGENKTNPKMFWQLAIIIGALGAVMIGLSLMPIEGTLTAALAMSGVLIALAGAFVIIGKAKRIDQTKRILTQMTILIGVLGGVLALVAYMPWKQSLAAGAAMTGVLIALASAFKIIGSAKRIDQTKRILTQMTILIGVLGGVLALVAYMPWKQSLAAGAAMSAVILALAGAFVIIGKAKKIEQTKTVLIMMAVLVGVLGGVVALIATQPWLNALMAAASMILVIGALVGAIYALGLMPALDSSKLTTIVAVGAVMAALGWVIALIAAQPWQSTLVAMGAMVLLIATLAGAIFVLSKIPTINPTVIGTLLLLSVAIAVLGTVMSLLGAMGGGALISSLLAIGGALALLAIGLNIMNTTTSGSLALLIAAAALVVLAGAMQIISTLSWSDILMSLVTLAGALLILGVAGYALAPVVMVIVGLAASLTLIGAAFLLAGAGALMIGMALPLISTGFAALAQSMAANGTLFVTGLQTIINGVLAMIPVTIAAIGAGIIQFCDVIIKAAPKIGDAVLAICNTIIQVISDLVPKLIDLGIKLIMALLNGISKNIGKIVKVAADIVTNFLNAIAKHLPRIIQAGINLIIAFIEGLGDGLVKNAPRVRNAILKLCKDMLKAILSFFGIHSPSKVFANIGKNLVEGLINGIKGIVKKAVSAVKNLGKAVLDGICKVLGIKSPSREAYGIGQFFVEGFNNGVGDNITSAFDSGSMLGNSAIDGLFSSLNNAEGSLDLGSVISKYITLPEDMTWDMGGSVTLQKGAANDYVKTLQQALMGLGYDVGEFGADGVFGLDSEAAVKAWQRDNGLDETGVVTKELLEKIKGQYASYGTSIEKLGELGHDIEQFDGDNTALIKHLQEITGQDQTGIWSDDLNAAVSDYIKQLESDKSTKDSNANVAKTTALKSMSDSITYNNNKHELAENVKGFLKDALSSGFVFEEKDLLNINWEQVLAGNYESLPKVVKHLSAFTEEELSELMKSGKLGVKELGKINENGGYITFDLVSVLTEQQLAEFSNIGSKFDEVKNGLNTLLSDLITPEFATIYNEADTATKDMINGIYTEWIDTIMSGSGKLEDYVPVITNQFANLMKDVQDGVFEINAITNSDKTSKGLIGFCKNIKEQFKGLVDDEDGLASIVDTTKTSIADLISVLEDPNAIAINPTITPVIDTTNVDTGIAAINKTISGSSSFGLFSGLGNIVSGMNGRGQNGTLKDVVSEVSKLKGSIDNLEKPTYVIKNIEYDDGTQVQRAIATIIRHLNIGKVSG